VIYGGSHQGMMGAVASAALNRGTEVVGVLPDVLLPYEVAHPSLTGLLISPNLLERKQWMIDSSDVVLTLSGGLGTLDEFLEVLTQKNLGMHNKPLILFDPYHDFDGLLHWMDENRLQGFSGDWRSWVEVFHSFEELKLRLVDLKKSFKREK
jgi:hypothetical protein